MNRDDRQLSEEMLNAFVDEELDLEERGVVLTRAHADRELAQRACELRHVKDLIQHAYPADLPRPRAPRNRPLSRRLLLALAASVVLSVGMVAGWMMRGQSTAPQGDALVASLHSIDALQPAKRPEHVILHLNTDDPHKMKAALDDAENLVTSYKTAKRPIRLEVIANSDGLNLLRADVSPEANRIQAMIKKYNNITFMACGKTMQQLRARGIPVKLLPNIKIAPSALQQIIERLKEGWVYIKV